MGACTSCTRKDDQGYSSRDINRKFGKPQDVFEYFEKNRDQTNFVDAPQRLQKASKLNSVFNSASNYWMNENDGLWDSTHRTAVTYRVDSMNQLLRVHNSIITESEYHAAKRIKELYLEYKKKREIRTSRNTVNPSMKLNYS